MTACGTTGRLAQAYRDAYEAWRRFPNSTTWRARQDAELALLDCVRSHGPFRVDMMVFAFDAYKLVTIEGVRTAEEIDAEGRRNTACPEPQESTH